MFLPREPSEEIVQQFILSQQALPFSYAQVGASKTGPREVGGGFTVDHNRTKLGDGEETYRRAVGALRSWHQFDLGWLKVVPAGRALEVGMTVAVQARTFGVWSLNATRIVYVIDDQDSERVRFGFAYGTLPDHVERGEERFMVEWRADDSVWYEIYAFSRPNHPLVRMAYPLARRLQKRFVRDSIARMGSTAG